MKYRSVSIVIPVYNESKFINKTIARVATAQAAGLKKQIVVVDDGSNDGTGRILRALQKRYKFTLHRISKNQGKGTALKKGFLLTTGDIVLVQDADLEYDPADYPLLVEPFITHAADVVYGSRFISHRPHRVLYFWHYLGNWSLTAFSNMLTNLNLSDMETGFKVFRGDIIRQVAKKLQSRRFGFEPEVTARLSKIPGVKFFEVGVSYWGRTYAEGKKIGVKDGIAAFWHILRYNLFP